MNSDSYKVIISVSHHRIAFEYWQRDGENTLVPMPGVSCPASLAFYCSQTGIEIGEAGVRAAHAGTANSFDKYFERLAEDVYYVSGGQKKPLRYIFLDAAEAILTDFFKNVLLGSKGTLSDNRASMPITLVCESDVKPNERALLLNLFRDSGYNRFKIAEYNSYIENYFRSSLANEFGCDRMLVAWTEGEDLTLSLFSKNKKDERYQVSLVGLGKDPRQEYVKSLIWERIKGQNPWLDYDYEEDAIGKAAMDFLSSSVPLLHDKIVMSDGMAYHYSLTRSVIDHLQCDEGALIKTNLEQFLLKNGIKDKKNVLLLLRGLTAGNIYFEQNLCPGFSAALKTDKRLRSNTMHLLISEPNSSYVVESDASESTEFKHEFGTRDFYSKDTFSTEDVSSIPSVKQSPDPKVLMKMNREMRAARANIKAKYSRGDKAEASKVYKDLIADWDNEVHAELLKELHDWLAKEGITRENLLRNHEKQKSKKPEPSPEPRKRPEPSWNGVKKEEVKSPKQDLSEGEQLLKNGKFSEAKRFFAGIGNEHMKQLCIDLLRDERDLKAISLQNASSLSSTARSNNLEKLQRIQKNYRKAGLDVTPVAEIIRKYK